MNKLICFILLAGLLPLAACAPAGNATVSPNVLPTQAEQPLSAPTASLPASVTPVNTVAAETSTAQPTPATSDAQCTDAATFIADVTIPDGTIMTPGQAFTKTWRLQNSGTCAWTTFYMVGLEEGPANAFWTDSLHLLTARIEPGQSVDVSANLTAPAIPGDYTAFYQLRNAAGVSFLNFTAVIKVQTQAAAVFGVTNITYTVSTWSDTVNGAQYINCPLITAAITANGAGTVEYRWVAFPSQNPSAVTDLSGEGYSGSLTFDAPGVTTVSQRWTYRESTGGKGMLFVGDSGGMYIDIPNHQSFEGVFLPVCASP